MKPCHRHFLTLGAAITLTSSSWPSPLVSPPAKPQALSSGAAADSHNPGVSADGRFVVFVSAADNLVTNDSNGTFDVFVRDRQLGKTTLVSVNAAGTRSGNGPSHSPTISANGQFVVFESSASDLVANDTNNAADVFVRDLVAGTTTLVSQTPLGSPGNLESTAPTMTPDGRYVLFSSRASNLATGDNNNAVDLFVRDLIFGSTTLVTRSYLGTTSFAGTSVIWDGNRQISDNGRFVVFHSAAANLVQGDINSKQDVFVRDLQQATNLAVSVNFAGNGLGNGASQNASMDASGRFVAFQSASSNLTTNDTSANLSVFRRDLVAGVTTLASVNSNGVTSSSGISSSPVLNKQGNVMVFLSTANEIVAGDTNAVGADLFRRNFDSGTTVLVDSKVAPATTIATMDTSVLAPSADGRFVLYVDASKNLVLFDSLSSTRIIISTNNPGADATMTGDAGFVVFCAPLDSTGVRNVYLFDQSGGTTELVSPRDPNLPITTGSAASRLVAGGVSGNGQVVVIESYAADLTAGDTNSARDVFLCDLSAGPNSAVGLNTLVTGFARGPARRPIISGDGHWLAFEAIPDSTPLAGLSTRFNLYAFDRVAQTNLLVGGVGSVVAPSLPSFGQLGNFLVFQSSETGVGGYATTISQIYYRDLSQDTNRLVSLNYSGTGPGTARSFCPVISPNGRYVAYLSVATGLVTNSTVGTNAFLWDALTGSNILASASASGSGLNGVSQTAFWANGSLLSFQQGNTTYLFDVNNQVVVTNLADAANVSLTADGRLVACERAASYSPADTNATTDVYVIDRSTGSASLVSVNHDRTGAGNGKSFLAGITPDGRYVLFRSRASNLASNDTNGVSDVFLRDLVLNRAILLSVNRDGTSTGNMLSSNPIMSADGSTVFFETYASDLVNGDYNNSRDLMLLRLSHGDSDGDGLPDDWELAYFNTLDRDGSGDYDGDGQTDRAEFLAGTDPTDANSVFRVITLSPATSGPVRVFWSAVPGKKYRVQFKNSVLDPSWTDLAGDVLATDSTAFKDDATTGAGPHRFYRVLLVF
jgi:Tol biopolymer transport system component